MSDEPQKQTERRSPPPLDTAESAPAEDFSAPAAQPPEAWEEIIRKLREENKQLTDQLLRKQADMENLRKRLAREKDEFLQFSISQTIESLLPILDGFELALASDGGGEEYRKGVELIYQQLLNTLQRMGLETIQAQGQSFDPHLHEAIVTVDTDQHPDQQIVEELQRGYFFRQRLLRPAKVKVAKRPSAELPSPNSDVPAE